MCFLHFPILIYPVIPTSPGIGCGLLFGPSLVVVGQYFHKRRALANGLALSGGSIGQLVIPMYLALVIRTYGFQVRHSSYITIYLTKSLYLQYFKLIKSINFQSNYLSLNIIFFI